MTTLLVRPATAADAAACAAIYAPYVTSTVITFEEQPPSESEMALRIERACAEHAWVVAEIDGAVVGYAYGGPFKARPAYRWSAEVSVYVELGRTRTGAGRALYEALLSRLAERGYRNAVAVVAVPNPASIGLHTALGFEPMGTLRAIGFKHGAWRDVTWLQRAVGEHGDQQPAPPV
ncbi:N-acetyltransferase [Rhodococcus triatomae]|uniref:Phosphinothricin acetyltransferase n=1 Tax=Rhodococcus triatomae TaxID=300028 RepID=A0A1G8SFI1_9NOCA|nr:GNAT family N-acetyltransferase [Rhodococcus triatomae]QNG20704.1 N-acetyltransferase [Rhodococcus triatomae]QNG23378.1 N-acetyltransferase [Rhodococcus triatomae]SDJ27961.1 phosphinothricin acetyltransferase [Rhodococcus triatomae]